MNASHSGLPQAAGRWAEDAALRFLSGRGLVLVTRNFRCRLGEIDLVMTDRATLVFVEVRYRRTDRFGSGAASVTLGKRRRLLAAASVYLARTGSEKQPPCRFDVVSVSRPNYLAEFEWIRDAFTADR